MSYKGYNNASENNKAVIKMMLEFKSWDKELPNGKIDIHNVEALRERFYRFLNYCLENGTALGNLSVYAAMGIDKRRASDMRLGRFTPEHQELMQEIDRMCAMFRECSMQNGTIDPTTGIWWQKNFDGFVDVSEVVHTNVDLLGEKKSMDEIARDIPTLDKTNVKITEYEDKTDKDNKND